ncbi:DUF4861 family protein [Pseudoduganella sp. UC29_106]|uniref:DUF4861 family protein n=1 Tax=Pseudoduganella sp. UC29_106 TaxID=3374553 RepID=UPI003757ECC9
MARRCTRAAITPAGRCWPMARSAPSSNCRMTAGMPPAPRCLKVKRFTVDAGHYFDQIDSTFTFSGAPRLTAALGLNKNPTDKGQSPVVAPARGAGSLSQWVEQKSNGAFGVAVIVPSASGYAEDSLNELITAPVESGKPLRYYIGAAWSRGSPYASKAAWDQFIAAESARVRSPIKIELK